MRELLVFGRKTFKIKVPDGAKVTFGPWSPPSSSHRAIGEWKDSDRRGTLRIYDGSKDNIVAVFSDVEGFRDLTLGYAEQVAKEEGATLWKDDEQGYVRESKVSRRAEWINDPVKKLPAKVVVPKRRSKKK